MKKKTLFKDFDSAQRNELKSVLKVAKQCNYEPRHTKLVTKIALEIFDDLSDLHMLGWQQRYYLLCAALLHDIGENIGSDRSHHKIALKIVLNTPLLSFNQKDRLIIGSIARYHRRALPALKHDHYKALSWEDREMVSCLAGILRIADGLDYSHGQRIRGIQSTFDDKKIVIRCFVRKRSVKKEIKSAIKKSDLLSLYFNRDVVFKIQGSD